MEDFLEITLENFETLLTLLSHLKKVSPIMVELYDCLNQQQSKIDNLEDFELLVFNKDARIASILRSYLLEPPVNVELPELPDELLKYLQSEREILSYPIYFFVEIYQTLEIIAEDVEKNLSYKNLKKKTTDILNVLLSERKSIYEKEFKVSRKKIFQNQWRDKILQDISNIFKPYDETIELYRTFKELNYRYCNIVNDPKSGILSNESRKDETDFLIYMKSMNILRLFSNAEEIFRMIEKFYLAVIKSFDLDTLNNYDHEMIENEKISIQALHAILLIYVNSLKFMYQGFCQNLCPASRVYMLAKHFIKSVSKIQKTQFHLKQQKIFDYQNEIIDRTRAIFTETACLFPNISLEKIEMIIKYCYNPDALEANAEDMVINNYLENALSSLEKARTSTVYLEKMHQKKMLFSTNLLLSSFDLHLYALCIEDDFDIITANLECFAAIYENVYDTNLRCDVQQRESLEFISAMETYNSYHPKFNTRRINILKKIVDYLDTQYDLVCGVNVILMGDTIIDQYLERKFKITEFKAYHLFDDLVPALLIFIGNFNLNLWMVNNDRNIDEEMKKKTYSLTIPVLDEDLVLYVGNWIHNDYLLKACHRSYYEILRLDQVDYELENDLFDFTCSDRLKSSIGYHLKQLVTKRTKFDSKIFQPFIKVHESFLKEREFLVSNQSHTSALMKNLENEIPIYLNYSDFYYENLAHFSPGTEMPILWEVLDKLKIVYEYQGSLLELFYMPCDRFNRIHKYMKEFSFYTSLLTNNGFYANETLKVLNIVLERLEENRQKFIEIERLKTENWFDIQLGFNREQKK